MKTDFAKKIKETIGYDTTVIRDYSTYELETGVLVTAESIASDAMGHKQQDALIARVEEVHKDLESILYQSRLLADQQMSAERIAEINNVLIALEKETVNLGSTIADGQRAGDIS